jgi:hypothetical protein
MMQLVAIGHDVVIETVDGSKVSRIVLAGKDPMLFEVADRKCQILELHWTRPLGELRKGEGVPLNVDVPIRADSLPTKVQAVMITREIQRRLNYYDVLVDIRTDAWFVEAYWYPLWFPFDPDQRPPTSEQEYLAGGHMSCGMLGTEISCTRWGR